MWSWIAHAERRISSGGDIGSSACWVRGGMGEVYLAAHPSLPRYDALKVLNAELCGDAVWRIRRVMSRPGWTTPNLHVDL